MFHRRFGFAIVRYMRRLSFFAMLKFIPSSLKACSKVHSTLMGTASISTAQYSLIEKHPVCKGLIDRTLVSLIFCISDYIYCIYCTIRYDY